jgi:hypothetical protein
LARKLHCMPPDTRTMLQPPTALIAIAIAVATGAATPQDADRAAPAVKHVMATMTVPASDAIFSAASEPPKDEPQWVALRRSTETLAESGRLLTTVDRARDDAEWIGMARALVAEAAATLKAVEARDVDALAQAGDSLYVTCKTCHDRYIGQ